MASKRAGIGPSAGNIRKISARTLTTPRMSPLYPTATVKCFGGCFEPPILGCPKCPSNQIRGS